MARWFFWLLDLLTPYFLQFFTLIRIVRWNTDREKLPSTRGKVVWDEAIKRGYEIKSVIAFGRYLDVYKAKVLGHTIVYFSIPTIDGQGKDSIWWMDDKAFLKKRLVKAGVPAPRGGTFSVWRKAHKQFTKLTPPLITKPRLGSRGRHTTTAIFTEKDLHLGFHVAKKLCHFVIVEEHMIGSVYRGTVVDGEVVGILRGDPPRITGDGVATITELIEKKNNTKEKRVNPVTLSSSHLAFLLRNGYTPESVIPLGKEIDLIEKVGLSYGGSSAEVFPETHPKFFEYLKMAAEVVNYPVIGFDFIVDDITKDPDEQKWGIIEANSAPFIDLHHFPLIGAPINVASKVWDMVERKLGKNSSRASM